MKFHLLGLQLNQYIKNIQLVRYNNVLGYIVTDGVSVQMINIATFYAMLYYGKIQNVEQSENGYYKLTYTSKLLLFYQDRQITNNAYVLATLNVNNTPYYYIYYNNCKQVWPLHDILMLKEKGVDFVNAKFVNNKPVSKCGEFLTTSEYIKTKDGYDRVVLTGCTYLRTNIIIPDDIEVIGEKVFMDTAINSVKMSSKVGIIEEKAFAGCSNLLNVQFGVGVQLIEKYAFYETAIQNLDLSKCTGLINIQDYSFERCESLQTVSLPEAIYGIASSVFNGCKSLRKVQFRNGVYKLEAYSFAKTAIEEVSLPSTVQKLGLGTFEDCKQLRSVDLSKTGITYLPEAVFTECSSLQAVKLPATLKEIGDYAFYHAGPIDCLDARFVQKIGKGAFSASGVKKLILSRSANLSKVAFLGTDVRFEWVD